MHASRGVPSKATALLGQGEINRPGCFMAPGSWLGPAKMKGWLLEPQQTFWEGGWCGRMITLPETNQNAPENKPIPNRKGSYSNHPFSGALAVSFREGKNMDSWDFWFRCQSHGIPGFSWMDFCFGKALF